MAECAIVLEACQRAGEKREHAFNWTLFLAHRWLPNRPFPAGFAVRPSRLEVQTGLEYASSGGQSNGKAEPRWKLPASVGDVVAEPKGSLLWTAQVLSNTSLRERIQTSTWTAPGGGAVTVSNASKTDTPGLQESRCAVTSDTPGLYDIVNEIVTIQGNEYIGILRLTIE